MMDERLKAAVAMALEAGKLAQQMRADPGALDICEKGPLDLVTAADHASEALLRKRILEFEPDTAILGEEAGHSGTGKGTWIVDPIDGTVNYSRGMPDWAVSVAYFDGLAITHGVIHAPDLDITAWAAKGCGSILNGRAITFDKAVSQSPLVALGYSSRGPLPGYLDRIERLLDAGVEHRRHGAATICFLGVLAGWFDAFYEPSLNIWDAAAGLLLIEEASGLARHDPFPKFLAGPSDVLVRNLSVLKLEAVFASFGH